jgi:hypothetical protein
MSDDPFQDLCRAVAEARDAASADWRNRTWLLNNIIEPIPPQKVALEDERARRLQGYTELGKRAVAAAVRSRLVTFSEAQAAVGPLLAALGNLVYWDYGLKGQASGKDLEELRRNVAIEDERVLDRVAELLVAVQNALRPVEALAAVVVGPRPPEGKEVTEEPADAGTAECPWEGGDDWDALDPLVKRLLVFMSGKKKTTVEELCLHVWGDEGVTTNMIDVAKSRANRFLLKRRHPQRLSREGAVVRWKT